MEWVIGIDWNPHMRQALGFRDAEDAPATPAYTARALRPMSGEPWPIAPATLRPYRAPMHDAAYKTLFSHPRVVGDLLRGFVPEPWTDALDLDSLEKLPAEFTSDDLRRQRRADAVWRIRFRGEWLYVLVLLEFQSTEDRYMALRILVYTGLLHQDLIRRGALGPHGVLPPVLPIVLYNGAPAWKAEAEVSRLIAPVHEDLARYQPSQRYLLLDEGRLGDEDLPERNLVSAIVRLEGCRTVAEVLRTLGELAQWLRGSGEVEFQRAFAAWVWSVVMPRQSDAEALADGPELAHGQGFEEVPTMLAERAQEWWEEIRREGLRAGREEGREEGRAEVREAQQRLLSRLAARKFDAATAERLSELLHDLTALERFEDVGDWIIESDTGAELIERTERMVRRSPVRGT